MIPNCIPSVEGSEARYVLEAVNDGHLAIGPHIGRFEAAVAQVTGAAHAIALSTGTAALHLALVVAGVRPGDIVLTQGFTFAATANAICHAGAAPVFFDISPEGWGLDAQQLQAFLEDDCERRDGMFVEKASGRRIGALLPVHLYGHPADMEALEPLAARYGIPVVEDGAEALGALYRGEAVGSRARLCCLSFNGNKVVTGGGGGMVLTSDAEIADRVRYLSAQAKDGPYEFSHGAVGFNYRMPNLNAAVALAQVEMLGEFVARKRRTVAAYDRTLGGVDGLEMWREELWATSSCWMAILRIDPDRFPDGRERFRAALEAIGVQVRPVWQPLNHQAPYRGFRSLPTPMADFVHATSLCLPCSTGITDEEIDLVTQTVVAAAAVT